MYIPDDINIIIEPFVGDGDLLNFISNQDTDYLIKNKITIEYEFYNFFKPLNPRELKYSICKRNTGYRFNLDINDNNSYEDY